MPYLLSFALLKQKYQITAANDRDSVDLVHAGLIAGALEHFATDGYAEGRLASEY